MRTVMYPISANLGYSLLSFGIQFFYLCNQPPDSAQLRWILAKQANFKHHFILTRNLPAHG